MALIAVTMCLVVRPPAHAGEAPAPPAALTPADTTLSDEGIRQRIDFIRDRLDGSRLHGQIWYWSWMTVNAGSAVGLGVVAGLSDRKADRVNFGVQAGLGAIGVADLLLRPLEARHGAAPIDGLPDETREERVAKLRAAERRLRANADAVEERASLLEHVGNVAVNGAAGLAIAFAGKKSDGLMTFITGVAGGEIQIWSQPFAPFRDWEDYRQTFSGQARRAHMSVLVAPLTDGGARAGLRWDW